MKKILFTFFSVSMFFSSVVIQAQTQRIEQASAQIEALLTSYAGGRYELGGEIIDIDSSTRKDEYYFDQVIDPYGTLHSCYLFIAQTRDLIQNKFAIGVFKNNSILWMSDSLMGEYTSVDFDAVSDINRDGHVDIVVSAKQTWNLTDFDMWIFSWDGTTAWTIVEVEGDGNTAINHYGILKDIDGDGVYELVGDRAVYDTQGNLQSPERVVFHWNGSKYTLWEDAPDLSGQEFTVANNLSASVKARVKKVSGWLEYTYRVTNSTASIQSVRYFSIKDSVASAVGTAPFGWTYAHRDKPSFSHFSAKGSTSLGSGNAQDSFLVRTTGLPSISRYYAQALSTPLHLTLSDTAKLVNKVIENIFNNSFVGTTVGPADPPPPFVPTDFLDTLSAYTTQSRALGWISSQTVADKYSGYFSTAKTQLQLNNAAGARATLQSVLRDVDLDSSATITSEAYALLRYNTEYLLDRLPRPKQLTIDDLISLKHEAYAKGWIGDEHFVKELDNGLENAKKHLARGDSVNCAKELEKFQDKVKKEYDKTVEDRKKNKSRDKRFVTEEGFTSLTKAAQSIIDRLPQKKKR
jgi:hypothetical protein